MFRVLPILNPSVILYNLHYMFLLCLKFSIIMRSNFEDTSGDSSARPSIWREARARLGR